MNRQNRSPCKTGDPVFAYRLNQPVVWYHRTLARSNRYCLYCGRDVSDLTIPSNKEHLIGKHFVPDGVFDGTTFNFLFRVCKACNDYKGNLERHISTMSLLTSPARATLREIDELAKRKASKDYHPQGKGKVVQDAHSTHEVAFSHGPMTGNFRFTKPPQMDSNAAVELALMHVQGFFALVTCTDPTTREGTRLLNQRSIYHVRPCPYQDWGNAQLLEVVRRVQGWAVLAAVTTANGFFQAEFRRDEHATGQWFWALEWNKSLRVIGVIKSPDEQLSLFADLPEPRWTRVSPTERIRAEEPLTDDHEDLLFRCE